LKDSRIILPRQDRADVAGEACHRSLAPAQWQLWVTPGKPRAEHIVARGEADLGIQLISEIVSVPGAELLGPLPGELQTMTVISTGIVQTATEPDAARALFKFLTSPAAAAVIKAAGMEPAS